jgi:hypothetical protein
VFDRKLAALAATSMIVLSPAAAAQSITLKCEIYWTSSQRIGGYEAVDTEWVDFSVFTLDMAGRKVINEFELAKGDKGTTVRDMVAMTPTKVMLCQGDKCQENVPSASGGTEYGTLTSIDLTNNTVTRETNSRAPNFINGLNFDKVNKAVGTCTRL